MNEQDLKTFVEIIESAQSIEWRGDTFKVVVGVDGDARRLWEIVEKIVMSAA